MAISEIKKRDGRIVKFEQQKITDAIHKALVAVHLKDGKIAKKLSDSVVNILNKKFKERIPSVEDIQDIVIEVLKKKGFRKVADEYLAYRKKKAEIRELQKTFGIELEPKLTVNALEVLNKRYLLRDENGKIVENPAEMFRRVAKTIAEIDKQYGDDHRRCEEEFYNVMSKLEFIPNSPTLFNAGASLGQLSACFVLPIEDSLESIFENVKNLALIEQTGGGVGFDFSKLRPKGDIVKSTKGVASGPVSFMRIFDTATEVIKAGGKRRGAMMGILRIDHPDILEFITVKSKTGLLTNFNLSVAVTDEFMKAVKENKNYNLINPRTNKPVKKLKARKIWSLIIENAWKNGDPGVIFIDEINRYNPTPHMKIESTNPCLIKNTFVSTNDGLVTIDKIHNPQRVVTIEGSLKPISWQGKTGVKEVFRIVTDAGYEITATLDHKFLTQNGIWKSVSKLKKNDKLTLGKGVFGPLRIEKVMAQILGWVVGDGFLSKDLKKLWLFFNRDEKLELLPIFKDYLDKINKGSIKPTLSETEIALKYSSNIAKIFFNLGLKPFLAHEKEVPESVFRMNKNSVKNFLSALFSADGSVQGTVKKGVSIRLSSSSIKLLKQVQLLLLQFSIFSKIYENRRMEGWRTLPNSKRKPKKYFCHSDHELIISRKSMFKFMEEIGFCLKSKNLKFEIVKPKKRIYRDNIDTSVKLIENIGKHEVYDLSEPLTHTFIANGFIVHNCGEQPLLPYESCNLGSINLSKMISNEQIDWEKLKKTVHIATHFLDNVIDTNKFPLPEIERVTRSNRKIGLGVMGFAELLIRLKIPYDSEKAINLAEKIMKFITEETRKKSEGLARKRGSFPNFQKSIFYERYEVMRNATVTTIAPTGSISIIAGCSSGIEPLFAISFMRNVLEGTRLFEVNPLFERIAKERKFYSAKLLEKIAKTGSIQKIKEIPIDVRKIFKTALDIKPDWHVRMQAAFQKYTDNAVSKTINLPKNATVNDVKKAFELAYKLKCKGITVYRYGSKSQQVLYIGEPHTTAESEYAGGCPIVVCPF